MVETLMYDSQHAAKSCENLNFLSYHSVFTFLRTILLSFWITGSLLNQCCAVFWSEELSFLPYKNQSKSLIFSSGRENSNFHNFTLCWELQLNEYETNLHFLQRFQSNTTVCLIIHMFCKSCEPEIVCFDLHSCRTISCSHILQNM